MSVKITSTNKKVTCSECKNEIDLGPNEYSVKDVFECPMCGIEYIVTEKKENGDVEAEIKQTSK